jgi:hypothetical protein
MAWSAASSYSVAPPHIIHFFADTFLPVGIVFGARSFYQKLTGQAIGGSILLNLGIIAEYLAAI